MPSDDRIPISEMTELLQMNNDDLVVTVQTVNGVLTTFKAPLTLLATHLLKVMQFASDLETTTKTIIGAINELAGGTGGASSLGELTDVTITSPSTGQVLTYDATNGKWVNGAGAELALTGEVIGSICSFNDGSDNQPLKSWKTTITPIQAGSGTPSPSNVRALSGRTQVVASKGGANRYDYTTDTDNRYFSSAGGTASSTSWRCSDYIEVTPSSKVIATGLDNGSASGSHYLCIYKQDKTFSRSIQIYANTDVVVNVASDEYYIRTSVRKASNEYLTAKVFEVVLEKTISLGATVYGGELDIKNGSAKSAYAIITLNGTESWTKSGNAYRTDDITGALNESGRNLVWCDKGEYLASGIAENGCWLTSKRIYFIPPSSVTDATEMQAWVANNNLTFVYPVATPTTLTTQAEDFNTSEGINQFYTDCGISDVVYFNSMVDDIVDICNEVIASKEKVLTGTLTAGSTSITLSDAAITTDSMFDFYTDDYTVKPQAVSVSTGSITLTFAAQLSNIGVKVVVK